jgi:hypothetical protein
MILKIERASDGHLVTLRVSGRLRAEDLDQLGTEIEKIRQKVVLDLEELKLVDIDAVRFLSACEENGVVLAWCPLYVREWINRERTR